MSVNEKALFKTIYKDSVFHNVNNTTSIKVPVYPSNPNISQGGNFYWNSTDKSMYYSIGPNMWISVSDGSNITGNICVDLVKANTVNVLGDISINGFIDMCPVQIGEGSSVGGITNTAVGCYSAATDNAGSAFGYGSEASGDKSTAFGYYSRATDTDTTSGGVNSNATGFRSTAFGVSSNSSGFLSSSFGYRSSSSGEASTSGGAFSSSAGNQSVAFGVGANSACLNSIAFGAGALADEDGLIAIASSTFSLTTTSNTVLPTNGFLKIKLNGLIRWIPFSDVAPL